jgi:hypothetical protein
MNDKTETTGTEKPENKIWLPVLPTLAIGFVTTFLVSIGIFRNDVFHAFGFALTLQALPGLAFIITSRIRSIRNVAPVVYFALLFLLLFQ